MTSSSDAVAPIASITVVAVVTALAQTAVWAVRPMVSYRALDLGATPFDLGVVGGAFSVLSLFFAVPAGRWVDRRGEVTAIAAGAAMVAATCAALVPARSLAALIVCHAVLGVASIVNVVGLQAIVANRATVAQRDRRFATFTMAVSFGQLLGPAVAGLIATKVASAGGWDANSAVFLVGAAVATLAASLAAALLPRRSTHPSVSSGGPGTPRPGLLQVMAIPGMPQAMLVSVTVLSAVDVLTTYLPAIGEAQGLSVASVSLLLSARAGASFLSRLLMPWLIARGGRRRVLIFSTLVPALLLCLWPWIDNLAAMFVLVVVIGFGLGIGQPMTMVWVANRAPDESRGIALGMRLTVNRLGQISVPLAVGAIAGMAGLGSVFVSMAALLGASTIAVRGADFDAEISAREPPAAED